MRLHLKWSSKELGQVSFSDHSRNSRLEGSYEKAVPKDMQN